MECSCQNICFYFKTIWLQHFTAVTYNLEYASVQFSRSVVSDSVIPMNRSTPGLPVHHQLLESTQTHCPSSRWCHTAISSSVDPVSSCLQFFPASGSFQMSQFFTSGGQRTGVSASTSVLPVNTQDWRKGFIEMILGISVSYIGRLVIQSSRSAEEN